MLSYTFKVLNNSNYAMLDTEEFDSALELLVTILIKGINTQVKRGLNKEYVGVEDAVTGVKGKININESIKTMSFQNKKMICSYDEFSLNSELNKIIKSTLKLTLNSELSLNKKKQVRNIMLYFAGVDEVNVNQINWSIKYDRNNQTYQMLISVCNLIVKGLIQKENDGKVKLVNFIDERSMHRIYESFILEYYKKEFPTVKVSASQIEWDLDDGFDHMLPRMQSDITLEYNNKILIIDAKYYSKIMQNNYEIEKVRSSHLYQIFAYVKNRTVNDNLEVSGLLLYAKTEDTEDLDMSYKMSGNIIGIKTLDLNSDFDDVRKNLNSVISNILN